MRTSISASPSTSFVKFLEFSPRTEAESIGHTRERVLLCKLIATEFGLKDTTNARNLGRSTREKDRVNLINGKPRCDDRVINASFDLFEARGRDLFELYALNCLADWMY